MKSHKLLKFSQQKPDKQNLTTTTSLLFSQCSQKVLTFTQRKIKPNQQSILQRSQEQIIQEYSSNPFFRKQLLYLLKTALRYNAPMEVEDYDCSNDFQKTDSHYQQQGQYLKTDLLKLKRIMAALAIDPQTLHQQ